MKVLVTDAELSLSVAAIRSVARSGATVLAAAPSRKAHGFRSRYVAERLVAPASGEAERFVEFIADIVERRGIDVVLPLGQTSTAALARYSARLPESVGVPVAPWPSVEIALSKRRTVEVARRLGVRVPQTPARSGFPVVAKRVTGSGSVRYADVADELAGLDESWIVQEYVPGEGRGFFALFDRGEPRAVFMHRRVREFPVTGGASTAAESIDDPVLRELGLRLLGELQWHGVAMVEFKLDARDGGYTLMEINPKFWGSTALAIAAGVDFPALAVRLATGAPVEASGYRAGVRFQWLPRDLLHAAARPRDLPAVLRDLVDPRVRTDVSLRDPVPTLAETSAVVRSMVRLARDGTLRYPHGRPPRQGR